MAWKSEAVELGRQGAFSWRGLGETWGSRGPVEIPSRFTSAEGWWTKDSSPSTPVPAQETHLSTYCVLGAMLGTGTCVSPHGWWCLGLETPVSSPSVSGGGRN